MLPFPPFHPSPSPAKLNRRHIHALRIFSQRVLVSSQLLRVKKKHTRTHARTHAESFGFLSLSSHPFLLSPCVPAVFSPQNPLPPFPIFKANTRSKNKKKRKSARKKGKKGEEARRKQRRREQTTLIVATLDQSRFALLTTCFFCFFFFLFLFFAEHGTKEGRNKRVAVAVVSAWRLWWWGACKGARPNE